MNISNNPLEGVNNALGNDPEALHDPDRFWNAYRENMPTQQNTSGHRISGGGLLIPLWVWAVIIGILVLLALVVMGRNGLVWLMKNANIQENVMFIIRSLMAG